MKKLLLFLFLFLVFIIPVNALEVNSKNVILYNLDTKEKVFGLKSDEKVSIASLTKIMTNIVAIENIKDLNKEIIITEEMIKGLIEKDAYVVGLKVGQKVTYNDLLHASLLSSGADASNALAIGISGSINQFVSLMNDKAKELGLKNTSFSNTIGLDAPNNYSTVEDVAKILMYAYKNETFKSIFLKNEYVFNDKSMTVKSGFRYMADYANIDTSFILGAKTGYETKAGRCLASIAYDEKNNINYLLVTVRADDDFNKMYNIKDAYNIYKHFFNNYSEHNLVSKDDLILTLKTKNLSEKEVKFYAREDIKLFYNNNDFNKDSIRLEYSGIEQIKPTTKKNTKIGEVSVYYKDEKVNKIDIILKNKPDLKIIKTLKENIFTIISVLVLIISLSMLILSLRKYLKVKKRFI